jgi:hypothetical protein
MKSPTPPHDPQQDEEQKPRLLQIVGSVLSAAIGIQNSRNHERDFKHGRARNFIIAGIVFTAVFVVTVFMVVSTVLKSSGAGH